MNQIDFWIEDKHDQSFVRIICNSHAVSRHFLCEDGKEQQDGW